MIRGDLTTKLRHAVRAVLEALGKKSGPGVVAGRRQRFHDAPQLA